MMLIIVFAFTSVSMVVPGYLIPTTKDISALSAAIGWIMPRYTKQSLLLKELKENQQEESGTAKLKYIGFAYLAKSRMRKHKF